MTKEAVIINTIVIKRQGERRHFQIKLPKDAKHIIGIECGGRVVDTIRPSVSGSGGYIRRNDLIGVLKLQSCEEANWFYTADVFGDDKNLGYGDFSNGGFMTHDYTHGNKRTEEVVKVNAESTIIQGWFHDAFGKANKMDINYEVKIYIWFNTEE